MTFEAWIMIQIEARATVAVRLGQAQDGTHASLMTWSDKTPGTHFWKVYGNTVAHLQFVGDED